MHTYGFISLGLIGGSVARAIREKNPDAKIIAYNRTAASLEEAVADGVVDTPVYEEASFELFRECDMIFLCAPVELNEHFMEALIPYLREDAILTDVGSVKSNIHKAAEKLGLSGRFIGGHPMAGSERVGYSNSKASILKNAYYIITPSEGAPAQKIKEYEQLVKSFGCIPLILNYERHDYAVAAISHLPHLIAASLVTLVEDSDSSDGLMKMIAAGGFKDITRIASSSSAMWEQICMSNTENIRSLLKDYMSSLQSIDESLEGDRGQDIYDLFTKARTYRDSMNVPGSGAIQQLPVLTIDIADEPGALAAIATILALSGISIKNIGILHNREYRGGDLKIEFETKEDLEKAERILTDKNYTIHRK